MTVNRPLIKRVVDNRDKQRTYREQKYRFKRAVSNEFYLEALMIDYALLEDRLRALLFHMGFLTDRNATKIWKMKKQFLNDVVSKYKEPKENGTLTISSISGKIKIIRCVLLWSNDTRETNDQDAHLRALKNRCNTTDASKLLSTLNEVQNWCRYRNEVIHGLMNKNVEDLSQKLEEMVNKGKILADSIDNQVKLFKKGNVIRKSVNLSNSNLE